MKKLMFKIAFLIVPLISFWGCQNSSNELSESEKDSIIQEVRAEYDKFIAASSAHDAAVMMQSIRNSEDFLFASNGSRIKGYDEMHNVVNSIHSNPELQSYSVELNEVIIRVISHEAALLSIEGFLINFPTSEGPKSIKIVVTVLMEKIDSKWLITVGHESTREDLENI